MRLEFLAKSENEGFARVSVSAFIAQLDPTIEELTDIKTGCFWGCNKCYNSWVWMWWEQSGYYWG